MRKWGVERLRLAKSVGQGHFQGLPIYRNPPHVPIRGLFLTGLGGIPKRHHEGGDPRQMIQSREANGFVGTLGTAMKLKLAVI